MVNNLQHFYYGSWQGAVYDPEGQGFNLFDDVVYSKGAWVLHTLARGGRRFRVLPLAPRLSRPVCRRQCHHAAVPGGGRFRRRIARRPGSSMPGCAARDGRSTTCSARRPEIRSSVTITQTQSASWPVFPMRLELRIAGRRSGHHGRRSGTDARTTTYAFAPGFVADSVSLDPQNRVLKQVTYQTTAVEEEPRVPTDLSLSAELSESVQRDDGDPVLHRRYPGARVRLVVYDVLGREVAVLFDERAAPGEQRVTFDASHVVQRRVSVHAAGRRAPAISSDAAHSVVTSTETIADR